MATRIFGILGKKRHGKDTFAARLCNEHGFTRFAFADALRDAALKLDPIVGAETGMVYGGYGYGGEPHDVPGVERYVHLSDVVREHGWEGAKDHYEYGDEIRRTLQHMGVGVRDLDQDFWVRAVMRQVDAHPGPVVITDVRFPNEVAAVKAAGGRTIRIVNPRVPVTDTHVSETALDLYVPDHVVMNAGTIEDLHATADRLSSLP